LPRRLLLAIALSLAAPGDAVGAESYTVQRPVASFRNAPGSFALGHVFMGARVDVVAWRRGWAYANLGGRCGWLMARGLVPAGVTTAATCPPPEVLAPGRLFAPGSYQLGCGEGCVYPARAVACSDRTAYANYDAAGFRDPVGREPVGRGTRGRTVPRYAGVRSGYSGFGLRYVTRDGVAALIKDSRRRGPVWRFVRAECVERLSLVVGGDAVGAFRVGRRVRATIRAFGRLFVRSGCLVHWPRLVVTVRFSGCRRFAGAVVERQRIRGSALVHTWTTAEGLRLGDPVARLRLLYPRARPFRGTFRLARGLRAVTRRGRVHSFRITPSG
jgi:hypothetical protein